MALIRNHIYGKSCIMLLFMILGLSVFSIISQNAYSLGDEYFDDEYVDDEYVDDEYVDDEYVSDDYVDDQYVSDDYVGDTYLDNMVVSDTTSPTLGLNSQGVRVVHDGFTYNNHSIDVDYFYTPYSLVTVEVGDENIAELKIFEDSGPEKISHVELAFGLAKGQKMGQSNAVIIYDIDFQGNGIVSQTDPENVIDDDTLRVEHEIVNCTNSFNGDKCLLVRIYHTFRSPLDFDIVATNVWDASNNSWQNFFNHGIHVQGLSINPEKGMLVNNDTLRLYPLTDDSNYVRVMVDENNLLYVLTPNGNYKELSNHSSLFHEIDESMYNIEEFASHGTDRLNSKFHEYKLEQNQRAQSQLNDMINYESIKNPSFDINLYEELDTFTQSSSTPEFLKTMEHRFDRFDPKFAEYKIEQTKIAQLQLNTMINVDSIENSLPHNEQQATDESEHVRFTPELLESMEHEKVKAQILFDKLFNVKHYDD